MENFVFLDSKTKENLLNPRRGETKFGERVELLNSMKAVKETSAKYIIFGIPEDIGIRANYGKSGAAIAWESFLTAFLNIQVNQFNHPENCVLLGHVACEEFMQKAKNIMAEPESSNPEENLGDIVKKIDEIVAKIIKTIVGLGKTPIIIGGGHNNAFGNIKGTSQALEKPVNILNFDAHTDLRNTDYRHSGNGFSFAKEYEFMGNYALFGIHKNYTPQYIFKACETDQKISIQLFEDLIDLPLENQLNTLKKSTTFLDNSFGIEIDCDAIQGFSSSAMTPSGFSIEAMRSYINQVKKENIYYLHICEAAPNGTSQIGKALSYFVSDFIREN